MLNLLKDVQQRHSLAILMISHDMAVVQSFCDRVAVLHRGCLVECGSVHSIFAAPQHEQTRRLVSTVEPSYG